MVLATICACVLPLEASFDNVQMFKTKWYFIGSVTLDVVFFIDIVVLFRTSILLVDDECFDGKTIAVEYFKSRFAIDLISTLPFDIICAGFVPNEW